jgi:hypothetical protein
MRWRFQFSLLCLMVLPVLVAIPVGWMAVETRRAKKQREAVEAIRKTGRVTYDYELGPPYRRVANSELPILERVRHLLPDDCFATPVHAMCKVASSSDLEHLACLTQLTYIDLIAYQMTDADLEHLERLTKLECLILYSPNVTDAGLQHLKALNNLECLVLRSTQVTDEGIKTLEQALPKCKVSVEKLLRCQR